MSQLISWARPLTIRMYVARDNIPALRPQAGAAGRDVIT